MEKNKKIKNYKFRHKPGHAFSFRRVFSFLVLLSTISIFLCPRPTDAASLNLRSSIAEISVGKNFIVTVSLDTQGETINNAEATLKFPTDLVKAVSVSTGASPLSLWVESPVISNTAGTISFNGGVPNPGYTGRGQLIAVTFRAQKSGRASFSLGSTAVRANDGLGTNILSSATGASVSIIAAPAEPEVIKPEPPVTAGTTEPSPSEINILPVLPDNAVNIEKPVPPIIIAGYSRIINSGDSFNVAGTGPKNTTVRMSLISGDGTMKYYLAPTAGNGEFAFHSGLLTVPGDYNFIVESLDQGFEISTSSVMAIFTVKAPVITAGISEETVLKCLITPANITIAILGLLILLSWYWYFKLYRKWLQINNNQTRKKMANRVGGAVKSKRNKKGA